MSALDRKLLSDLKRSWGPATAISLVRPFAAGFFETRWSAPVCS